MSLKSKWAAAAILTASLAGGTACAHPPHATPTAQMTAPAISADPLAQDRATLHKLMKMDWSDYGDRARTEARWTLIDMARRGDAQDAGVFRAALDKLAKTPVVGSYLTQEQKQYQFAEHCYREWQDGNVLCNDYSTPPAPVDMTPKPVSGAEMAKQWRQEFVDAAGKDSPLARALAPKAVARKPSP